MVGIADLPLHYGHVPDYLLKIMKGMCDSIVHSMIYEFGEDKLIERLSNPFWFQALNNAIGMDWDSSGSTTVLLSLLKQVIDKNSDGIAVLGGKGRNSLSVMDEADRIPNAFNVNSEKIKDYSLLSAKTDTVLLQDGYNLYIHYMLVSKSGKWLVIQQGMNPNNKFARRYHLSDVDNFECEPNSSISGFPGSAISVIKRESNSARKSFLEIVNRNEDYILMDYLSAVNTLKGNATLELNENNAAISGVDRLLKLNYYRPISIQKLRKNLEKIKKSSLPSISDALIDGMTASTARALFLISDLIYKEPPSFNDPVDYPYDPFKYSFAIGGKDGIPYPVNKKTADEVLEAMKNIVYKSKLESKHKSRAILRLDKLTGKT